ncbi:MAG: aldose 1-epimerase [Frankiales bacterium]|nr:aldose 1-epimerase [Frankiales bacterium]
MTNAVAEIPPPSGRQWLLRNGNRLATVVEIGGGLREYVVDGRPVLDGFAEDAMCSGARGTTLAPWPNRLRDGHYRFADEDQQLALSEPSNHNAIHGLVRWRPWTLVDHGEDRLSVEVVLLPQPGYPFWLRLRNDYRLDADGLTVTTTATNIGHRPLPYGLGFHPYLTLGSETIDADVLTVPAATWLQVDERGLPTGSAGVDGTPFDYRTPRPIGSRVLDTAFTDLVRGQDGRASVTLATEDGSRSVSLWADETFPYLQVFSGDTLPAGARRRGLAVEPMTCGPDAFNTGQGLVTLAPGRSLTTAWGLVPRGYAPGD